MHQSFVRAVEGRGEPEGSSEDAFASAAVVAAAYASLAGGGWVRVEASSSTPGPRSSE